MTRRLEIPALLLILGLAFGLRFWSVGWGLPFAFHADEQKYMPIAVRMLEQGSPNPRYFENPPLLTYVYYLELLILLAGGKLMGIFGSAADIKAMLDFNPAPLYLAARMHSVLLGTATVLMTYLVGRKLLGTWPSLAGALLLAVAFLPVRDSHYAVNDIPATFLLMASFLFATRIPSDTVGKGLVPYLLSGLLLGLATATKYNVALGAAAVVAAHLLRYRSWRDLLELRSHLPLLAAGGATLAGFLLGNPYALLDYPAFIQGFTGQYGWAGDPYSTSDTAIGPTILRSLLVGTGPAALVLTILGLATLARQRGRTALLLASFPTLYLAFFLVATDLFYARFALPAIPFLALLAGYGITAATGAIRPARLRGAAAVALLLLLTAPPLVLDARHNTLLRTEDTRVVLGRWMEENVPPGSRLAVEGYSYLDTAGRPMGARKLPYDMEILPSLRLHPLEHYTGGRRDYLIVSSFVYDRYDLAPQVHAEAIRYYERLDRELALAASFHPTGDGRELPFLMDDEITPIWTVMDRSRPGPSIKVYRLSDPPEYAVGWTLPVPPSQVRSGQGFSLGITLANRGNLPWPAEGYTPVRIGYRWLDGSGGSVAAPELHSPLPHALSPGETAPATARVTAPSSPGSYTLQLDLVWENFSWLSAKGAATLDIPVLVR